MTCYNQYKVCIEACLRCAAVCNNCSSMCAKNDKPESMTIPLQLTMETAAICYAAAQLMSLGSDKVKEICKLCAVMCDLCAAECNKFIYEHPYCQASAEACTKCADECEVVSSEPVISSRP